MQQKTTIKEKTSPQYFQESDLENRLGRKMPLSFVPTNDLNWWCIVLVTDIYGEKVLSPLFEVRIRNEDDPKYMQEILQKYCEKFGLLWIELDERVPRKPKKSPLAEERDEAKIALMRWSKMQSQM